MSEDTDSAADVTVDARGLLCPAPVIELARRVRDLPSGTVVALIADDPAAATDVPAWCRMRGHDYVDSQIARALGDGALVYRVRVGASACPSG